MCSLDVWSLVEHFGLCSCEVVQLCSCAVVKLWSCTVVPLCSCTVALLSVGAHGWLVTSGPQSFSYLSHLPSSSSSSSSLQWSNSTSVFIDQMVVAYHQSEIKRSSYLSQTKIYGACQTNHFYSHGHGKYPTNLLRWNITKEQNINARPTFLEASKVIGHFLLRMTLVDARSFRETWVGPSHICLFTSSRGWVGLKLYWR